MPMVTNPTAGDVHVSTPLTNFSQKWIQAQANFVSIDAMPNAPVAKQADLYYEFSRADFFRDEAAERADGAESAGGGFTLSTSPYFANVFAFHKDVTDRQRANADGVVRLDQSVAQFVSLKLMIRREVLFANTFFVAGQWGTDDNVNWSGASTPISDVRVAISAVHAATGLSFVPETADHVTVEVFDANNQFVALLFDGLVEPGTECHMVFEGQSTGKGGTADLEGEKPRALEAECFANDGPFYAIIRSASGELDRKVPLNYKLGGDDNGGAPE